MKGKINFKETLMHVAGVGVGGAVAGAANNVSFFKTMDKKIVAGIKIAVGAFAPTLLPKVKIARDIGDGMIAVGAYELAHALAPDLVPGLAGLNPPVMGALKRQPSNRAQMPVIGNRQRVMVR